MFIITCLMNIWKIKNRAGYFWRNKDDVELKEINQESSSRVSSFLKTKTVETITDGVFAFGFFFSVFGPFFGLFFVFATKPQHFHHQGRFYNRTFTSASGCKRKIWLRSCKTKEYRDFFNLCEVKFINIRSFTSIILSNYCLNCLWQNIASMICFDY